MRLERIKLAGFKSFVDPTTVQFPSHLVGVVGPNGCGKSNVIDAVRWVMGEMSAKTLRGESMADVIFSGSTGRKPVGTATIELIFDNADGSAGGQYAQYGQISVKRQVSRDGQSSYFLNGVRCRRRDITDLFLGTGLGPRSYSIIEQGMISRLVEARPEDLRIYLEEAAGISKYKERRRETESRIAQTRENLARLSDLRDEVGKQLQHLERQAATAEKYKDLKAEERRVRAELLALRWRGLEVELGGHERTLAGLENRMQAALAVVRRLEADIELAREQQADANQVFNAVQGRFYAVGAEIARLEQAIQFARESRRRSQDDLERAEQLLGQAREHHQHDALQLAEISAALAAEVPRLDELRSQEGRVGQRLAEAEQALQRWQGEWDDYQQKAAEPTQTAQVERTRINHLEQQEEHWQRRVERLREEAGRLQVSALDDEIRALEATEVEQRAAVVAASARVVEAQARIGAERAGAAACDRGLDVVRGRLQTARGRLASLEALQQAALGKHRGAAAQWLKQMGIADATRLAQGLDADPEWQRAVEAVLDIHLEAACVADLTTPAAGLGQLDSGAVALFDTESRGPEVTGGLPDDALLHRVRCPWTLRPLLGGVRCAADLDEALRRRADLSDAESLITPDGVWVGSNWLRAARGDETHAGVLARERELKALAEEVGRLGEDASLEEVRLQQLRAAVAEAERHRDGLQQAADQTNRVLAETLAHLSGRRARAEQIRHRVEATDREIQETIAQIAGGQAALVGARERLHHALGAMDSHASRREGLLARRDELRGRVDDLRSEALRARNTSHDLALRVESLRASERSLRSGLERMDGQLEELARRREELQARLSTGDAPLAERQAALDDRLGVRLQVEGELGEARAGLDAADQRLRDLESRRGEAEQGVEAERAAVEAARLARQEIAIRSRTAEEQFAETGFDCGEVLATLGEGAAADAWQERLDRLTARIQRLGPINLAAIDEFKEQAERKAYLDAQYADVNASLDTLETAIRKIDRETRTRFQETFDRVNAGLQDMFPKLFGGGHAYLEMVGEELLDAGVAVMARPPGKRNSSIHLLSGGEKALTAVALVFAIFQLNPAPFCMLDEVDAPLDDANVGRFCELVKEMSEKVQFIFITHNKVTMEVANQLIGVTMHEPGVSRLVSVDIDEAARLAAI
jgi:chromosome segregation protein